MGRRIALVCAGDDGIGVDAAAIAGHLTDRGDRVAILGPGELRLDTRDSGARFAPVPVAASVNPVVDVKAALTLRSLLRGPAGTVPDVVHAFGPRAGLAASLSKIAGVALVVTWRDGPAETGQSLTERALHQADRFVAKRADVNLCASTDLVPAVLRLGAADARHMPVTVPAGGSRPADGDPLDGLDAVYRELIGRLPAMSARGAAKTAGTGVSVESRG